MTSVNPHTPLLLGRLFRDLGAAFATEDWDGLRQSHFRVLAAVPHGGISITDLAERLDMTKQGCGQLVTALVEQGRLRVGAAADRRVRVVRPTAAGERTYAAVQARIAEIEAGWAAQVGADRYAAFRSVLEEIAAPQTSER